MEDKSIELYCQYVIKPLEIRMRNLEEELIHKRFFRHKKEIELRIVKELLTEKLLDLNKMLEDIQK
ncbi:MAG TPA: hypothetical protein IAB56_01500 [Candidatus Scybalousia intestinigallinarum]|nr:hypothetical protein [Candidatus Scybalousia intestinigallinarum]